MRPLEPPQLGSDRLNQRRGGVGHQVDRGRGPKNMKWKTCKTFLNTTSPGLRPLTSKSSWACCPHLWTPCSRGAAGRGADACVQLPDLHEGIFQVNNMSCGPTQSSVLSPHLPSSSVLMRTFCPRSTWAPQQTRAWRGRAGQSRLSSILRKTQSNIFLL